MKKITLTVFLLVAVSNLTAVTFHVEVLNLITKPLLVPALVVYYLTTAAQKQYLFLTALFFCWLGDVLLMWQQAEIFFIAGLLAFLTGHVLYCICYRNFRGGGMGLTGPQRVRFSLPVILAGTGLVTILFPHLGALRVPVMVYALVITLMALQALFRYGYTNTKSFALVVAGALFFMLSDSLLAVNKFMKPLPMAGLAIMFTYILAQYLIVEGVVRHEPNR